MSVYKPKHSQVYLYDFQCGGTRFHGSTGEREKRAAEEVERRERDRARAVVKAAKLAKSGPMTMDIAAGRYWDEVGKHTATARDTERDLERLVLWIGAGTLIRDITDDTVATLVARRRGERKRNIAREIGKKGRAPLGLLSPAQVNRSVTQLLRRVLTRARKVWKQHLPDEPHWSQHMLAEARERVRELSYGEEDRLAAAERDDYRAPRLFAQITGLRRREVANLTWPQVDWEAGLIRVVGKGDKPHVIPITPDLTNLLWPLRGQHETAVFTYVCRRTRVCARSKRRFVRGQRYPITYEGLATQLGRAIKKAGLVDFRPVHDFRHTAASRFQRANGDLRLTQALLNHASPKMTVRYAHVTPDDLRDGLMRASRDDESRRTESRKTSRSGASDPIQRIGQKGE